MKENPGKLIQNLHELSWVLSSDTSNRLWLLVITVFHCQGNGIAKHVIGTCRPIGQRRIVEASIGAKGHSHRAGKGTGAVLTGALRPCAGQGLDGGRCWIAEGIRAWLHTAEVNVASILICTSNAAG